MTKTQANEPGFVLVPREPTEAMKLAGESPLLSKGRQDDAWSRCASVYRAMLAAAPIVPAPAYGVKALEWRMGLCDEDCTIEQAHTIGGLMQVRQYRGKAWFDRADGSKEEFASVDEAKAAAQADFERRILSCLSSAPVEEADAKAWEKCADCGGTGLALNMAGEPDECRECNGNTVVPTIPSEPEAKGEAGAGPVGEATDAMIEAGLRLDLTFGFEKDYLRSVWRVMSAARPVEEPGEVVEREDYLSDAQARELFDTEDGDDLPDGRVRVCQGEWVRIPGGYYFDKSSGLLHPETASSAEETGKLSEIAILRNLLETAYRDRDAARSEADKADDEALHWKTVAAGQQLEATKSIYEALREWKRRAERAEAASVEALENEALEFAIRRKACARADAADNALAAFTGDEQEGGR